jgi:hypothetical protein
MDAGVSGDRRGGRYSLGTGKPWQNATDKSFNGNLRDECLSVQWFRNRIDARVSIEQNNTR